MASLLRTALVLVLAATLCACATTTVTPVSRPPPEHAIPPHPDGTFFDLESEIHARGGDGVSGFQLIDRNEDALRLRLALIDSAQHSIDVQYYIWFADAAGRLLFKRLLDAADRGVKVRVLVDDLNTLIADAHTVSLRDVSAAWADAHPDLEIRLFNPWSERGLLGRIGEGAANFERFNMRMHNKSMIVDNRAVILGGRNIGDEYMGLNADFNFRDLDVIGIGPVARQASVIFDLYWNSSRVIPVSALDVPISDADLSAGRAALSGMLEETPSLSRVPLSPQSWSDELAPLPGAMHVGTSRVISDKPQDGDVEHLMLEEIHSMLGSAQSELLIENAYIIPSERGIGAIQALEDRGVSVKVVTNSLASHDVPAVNSHYKYWRKPILETGSELYELRHDAVLQATVSDTAPVRAEFVGLHAKAMVVDRERVYVGSMNYDPRSAQINTEMGVFIESPGLGEALAELIERDLEPENSWQVELDEDGGLRWINDEQSVTSQPARSWWQRVQDFFFEAVPKEYY